MNTGVTIRRTVRFGQGKKAITVTGSAVPVGRLPRVTRLLALAHRFEQMIHDGVVKDYAELARLGHVSRARLSQIMDLLLLAPEIQDEILFRAPVDSGKDPITERALRRTVEIHCWERQLLLWRRNRICISPQS